MKPYVLMDGITRVLFAKKLKETATSMKVQLASNIEGKSSQTFFSLSEARINFA